MGEEILIVDGYNIINAWPELIKLKNESLEHARDRLLDLLSNFQGSTGFVVVVVFDAHLVKRGVGSKESLPGLEIIFTQEGETADSCIERLVTLMPRDIRITVATSDWAQQRLVMGQGALRLSARELLMRIREAENQSRSSMQRGRKNNTTIHDVISADIKATLEKWRRGK
ncbi:NYN domain-containing protein [Candidatus Formimonas warabiya]|uniref:NYN domain-containing protein n=1 Tax=Formimonas warabiya TaxID=1761012 RepID=UPI001BE4BF43|nr:NYN domain-containing protein [Candidatus Formimonas warabiya]